MSKQSSRLGDNQLLMLDFPQDIQGMIVKIAARGNPKFLRLSKFLSWKAMQGLYQLVQLKDPRQAVGFIYSLGRNTLVNTLNSTRVEHLPATSSLIKKLYFSFDVGRSAPGGIYRSVFCPKLRIELPRMSSLQELIFDISDGSNGSFKLMTHPNFVYPPSLTTVRMISVDVDGKKTRGRAVESHPLWMISDLHDRIARIPFVTKLEVVHSHNIAALDLLDDLKESSIHREFSVISHFGGTAIREIVVWHNVEVLGISPGFQVLGFHPAKKVTYLKEDGNDEWMAKLGCDEEQLGKHLEECGWKIVRRICSV